VAVLVNGSDSYTLLGTLPLGMALVHHQGDRGHLAGIREEAEALRREPLEPRALAHLLHFLAFDALSEGGYGRAGALAEEVLALNPQLVNTRDIVRCLIILGMIALVRDHEQAVVTFNEGLHLSQKLGDKLLTLTACLGWQGRRPWEDDWHARHGCGGRWRPCRRIPASLLAL
jgi:hypothetical protein